MISANTIYTPSKEYEQKIELMKKLKDRFNNEQKFRNHNKNDIEQNDSFSAIERKLLELLAISKLTNSKSNTRSDSYDDNNFEDNELKQIYELLDEKSFLENRFLDPSKDVISSNDDLQKPKDQKIRQIDFEANSKVPMECINDKTFKHLEMKTFVNLSKINPFSNQENKVKNHESADNLIHDNNYLLLINNISKTKPIFNDIDYK